MKKGRIARKRMLFMILKNRHFVACYNSKEKEEKRKEGVRHEPEQR